MNTRTWWLIIVGLLIVIVVLLALLVTVPAPITPEPVATSTPNTNAPLHDRVVVTSPSAGSTVAKAFTVTGEAPGNWYFEASFPIQIRDADNNKVAQGIAQAQSDWMTVEQVPFKADITIDTYSGPATLVLMRDNPSGLPEHDDSLSIPIIIK